ncbi:MAG: vWA domain-containing protein [Flavobacteriaceae bacterium]
MEYTFAYPEFFWGLLAIPVLVAWHILSRKKQVAHVLSTSIKAFTKSGRLPKWQLLLLVLRMLAIGLILVALARPQTQDVSTQTKTNKGIDIVMAIDVSSSMLARDLKPSRLSALKKVAASFIANRTADRIGLVVYAGESYTKTPITSDKALVVDVLNKINYDGVINDGTAIGMGLATAVNRLRDSKAKSKVIILLTDGVNNTGFVDPKTAAGLASSFGIKTYTIGLGSNGSAPAPVALRPDGSFVYQLTKVEIDEDLLKDIAKQTGGSYYRATDNKKLEAIYKEIDKLERTEVEEIRYTKYHEKFRVFVFLALAALLSEWLLRHTLFKSAMA